MLKKIYFTLLIFFTSITLSLSNTDVYIFATVNEKIITNFDVKKEIEYLKILNPNISKLDKKKIFIPNKLINIIIS